MKENRVVVEPQGILSVAGTGFVEGIEVEHHGSDFSVIDTGGNPLEIALS